MKQEAPSIEILRTIEEALASHQIFGDSSYIVEQMQAAYRRRLERLSNSLPSAGELIQAMEAADEDARYRTSGNTVIRCAIQHANFQIETGTEYGFPLAQCGEILEATSRHLQTGKPGTPFEHGVGCLRRLGSQPFHGSIWAEEYPDNLFGRSFRSLLAAEYGAPLCTLTSDELANLKKGERLLRQLLPVLAPSALRHAHLIGCFPNTGFWLGKISSSQFRMGGVIFLSRNILKSPWCVAEHLLHESLHHKLYDFRHGHTLLEADYARADAPRIRSLWNAQELNNSNLWDTHRAFAAFHVYVQLSLLALVAEQRAASLEATYGAFRGMIESRKAMERARYLGEQLKTCCGEELGVAGKRLVDWLLLILDAMDEAPPPDGAYLHLVLDLYRREANKVQSALSIDESSSRSLSRQLLPLAAEELESTRRIFASMKDETALRHLDAAIEKLPAGEHGSRFSDVRGTIANLLLKAAPDGYRLASRATGSEDPNLQVRKMVEAGSRRLYLIMTDIPSAVADAKLQANELRFSVSCEDKVGRLLSILAAAVPSGGRILEIGTGAGVGAAWLCSGLGQRTDVEFISIEVDPRLAEAVRSRQWPSYMRMITGDARDKIASLGTFNLIFTDAPEMKYGHMDSTVRALRPGGLLVIDDLNAGPRTTDTQQAEKEALRGFLLDHPNLRTVELDWSSGVILAANSGASGEGSTIVHCAEPAAAVV